MSQIPLHLYFTKYFWKTWYKKKKKAWQVFIFETKKKYRSKITYKYVFWKITKTDKKKKKFNFRISFPISRRKISFLLKTNYKPWWWNSMITITVLVLLGLPTAYFGYPKLKEYKFYKFKKTALAALQSDDLQTALLTSQAAYLLNREDFPNLKNLVESAEKLNHPRHLEWLKILANHQEAGANDHRNYINALLQNRWLSDAETWLTQHASSFPEKDRIFYQCLILPSKGEESKFRAIQIGLEYISQNPGISPLSEYIWDLSLQSQQIYFYEEAVKQMIESAKINSSLTAPALRRLLKTQTGSLDKRKEWAKKLWSMEDLSLLDAILCLNASFGKKVINGNSILYVLQKDFPELSTQEAKDKLVTLLNQVGRPETAQHILENAETNTTRTKKIFLQTIQSALQHQDNDLARDLIDQTIPVLSPTEKIFFDHLLEEVLSKRGLSSEHLAKLFEECNEQELETIRMFLRFFQTPDFLLSFIEQMEILKPDQIGLKYLLATSYHRTGEFSKLQEIIRRTPLPETVGDIAGERQTCIQKALYGMEIEACTKWAETAFSQSPESLANRFTLALCYLQKNDHQNARSLLAPILQGTPPLCPTQRIIGALTLYRNGADEMAKKWAPVKHISLLTDAEKKLLGEIMHSKE